MRKGRRSPSLVHPSSLIPHPFGRFYRRPAGRRKISRMDIVGVGTDIVECLRVGRMIERHGELFLTRVYTDRELRYCQARKRSVEHFAARWAAKEAILKSLGTGWSKGICWTDVEVVNEPGGKPTVHLGGATLDLAQRLRLSDILLTMS